MEYTSPIQIVDPLDVGEAVDDSRRKQQLLGGNPLPTLKRNRKMVGFARCVRCLGLSQFDRSVPLELIAPQSEQLGGKDSISREKAVQALRLSIPQCTRIADKNASPATSQNECGTQPRRPSSDDDYIVQMEAPCRRNVVNVERPLAIFVPVLEHQSRSGKGPGSRTG